MKNSFPRGSQIRSNKKFNTTVKPTAPLLASGKLRKSIKNKTILPASPENEKTSPKVRKSTVRNTTQQKTTDKKKTQINKGTKGDLLNRKSGMPTSSLSKDFNTSKKKSQTKRMTMKLNTSKKKSINLDNIKISSKKENLKNKEINDINPDNINKDDLNINTLNSENNTKLIITEENSKINEINTKSNQENEKSEDNITKNNLKETQSKHQSKNESKRQSKTQSKIQSKKTSITNNKNEKTIFDNNPININLVKEINEKPNYRYEFKYETINKDNEEQDLRLRNYKLESSEYITTKNKNMMRNLLYLLDKKEEDKKGMKNIFRTSLNRLNMVENNRLLDALAKTKQEIFKIKNDEKLNYINQVSANQKMSEIYHSLFEQNNNIKNLYENSWNKPQSQPYFKEKYFFNYVDGKQPNSALFSGNNAPRANNIKLSQSYDKNYHVMGKNNLLIEKRDNGYYKYNFDSMINTLDNKLNKDYREIYRNRRMQKIFEDINYNIHSMSPQKNSFGKTYF